MNEELVGGLDIRGKAGTGLTVEYAWNVGKAVADWLGTAGQVVVMTVASQAELAHAVTEGLRLQGRDVLDAATGDKDMAKALIAKLGLSGAIVVGYDELEKVATIELYQEDGRLVDGEMGLRDIRELVEAGNFVPAAIKGELTNLA